MAFNLILVINAFHLMLLSFLLHQVSYQLVNQYLKLSQQISIVFLEFVTLVQRMTFSPIFDSSLVLKLNKDNQLGCLARFNFGRQLTLLNFTILFLHFLYLSTCYHQSLFLFYLDLCFRHRLFEPILTKTCCLRLPPFLLHLTFIELASLELKNHFSSNFQRMLFLLVVFLAISPVPADPSQY